MNQSENGSGPAGSSARKCYARTRVSLTRVLCGVCIRRVRECPGCEFVMVTEENPEERAGGEVKGVIFVK